ncbi:NAD-dependent epimerase/dehydratase family protein [Nocardioides marmoribigeumensis]|uniref:Nucleoside-diphosphate-sugar epimerase n=1 Tax=Nocardioides marmoribigeumensis TaxID=433649 RepID=A0ABU2BVP5_9ACTN|nr:NAD-dependent epimerase/dehydratase family protein [Nocardioides marmoribigeumensis]MDR7362703.1 nucleoside-diphosphate-sugar epimerase [Nocardioides marmoribigeumensis]
MKVLLTGGTGYVGAWTAKACVDAGHEVRYLVRTPEKLARSAGALGLDTSDHVVGDITDSGSVRRAMEDCEAVIHCAAVVALGPEDAEWMSRTNLEGARHVLGQAVEQGLDPVVHCSSAAALFRPGLPVLTADLPVLGGLDDYGRSKGEVEEYARSLQSAGAPVVCTYPVMVLGPPAGDQLGEANEGLLKGLRLRMLPGTGATWTVCDVRDLGRAHAALLEPGRGPRRYVTGGVTVPVREAARVLSEVSGRRVLHVPVPDAALRGFGRLQDRLRLGTPMTASAMEYYTRMPDADNEPMRTDLGVEFRDPRETLADACDGLRRLGHL